MLIGREAERERISALLGGAAEGRSGALVIVGDPGVGKTALVEHAISSAGDLRVARATGFEMETDLAFAGLASILGPFVHLIEALVAPQAAALSGALGIGPPLPPGDRFTAYVGALNVLAEAAESGPLLVVVDDAHWLDPASLDALAFVARRVTAEGIAILAAARHEPPAMTRRTQGIEVLQLEGLPLDDARRLIEGHAGRLPAPTVTAQIAHQGAGNPLALIEAVDALSAAQLSGSQPLPDVLPVGEALARAFTAQARALDERSSRALLIAAAG
ncbi:MAG: ATP-binding protein [Actinobacteria bacterium]|nr:ATP-binding protein [Actinomycetota bacterium]